MRLTPDNISLWIVNYRRTAEVIATVDSWLASFPFECVNIIDNYGGRKVEDFSPHAREKIKIWPNCLRPQWLTGSMSQCVNEMFINSFSEKDWVLGSHDDTLVVPGWADLINNSPYEIYLAPYGGATHLTHFNAFKKIGFWNELFRIVGGPEEELKIRVMRHMPNEASIHDQHPWNLYHNDVGLNNYWSNMQRTEEILTTRIEFSTMFGECRDRFVDIYGKEIIPMFLAKEYNREPSIKYINWYPSATKHWKEIGRIKSDEYFLYDDMSLCYSNAHG